MAVAETNAKLRKANITSKDISRLKFIQTRAAETRRTRDEILRESHFISKKLADYYKSQQGANSKSEKASTSELKEEEKNELLEKYKILKEQLTTLNDEFGSLSDESLEIRLRMPNYTHPDSPIGTEENAIIIGKGGDSSLLKGNVKTAFEGMPIPVAVKDMPELDNADGPDKEADHLLLAAKHGWIDTDRNRILAGTSWPILYGPLATLEHALVNYAMEHACNANFTPVVVPDAVRRDILNRTGFSPREGGGGQTYWVSSHESTSQSSESLDDLALAATAEIPLIGMCAKTMYKSETKLPEQYVASSHAFRAEAGARGQESRGLYRVHQFTKVEMVVLCRRADSEAWMEKMRNIQEGIVGGLGIPYRVLNMPTEELGSSAFCKYDIEAWMPGRGSWGEISSASNCTEYQSRRLDIRYRETVHQSTNTNRQGGENTIVSYVHTLNGTAVAVPRMIVALLENYGVSKEGKLRLPFVLKKHWQTSSQDQVEWIGVKESRKDRAIAQIRRMSQHYGTDPASMVFAFAILHELTAIIPLVIIFYLLGLLGIGEQVTTWLLRVSDDESGPRRWLRSKINEGMQRAERYGRKKGYFGFEAGSINREQDESVQATTNVLVGTFANIVAAYAITKALFPLRIGASIALAGPFARLLIEPVKRYIRRARTV